MLTLWADGAQSLWDEVLPVEVRELPEDLARLDVLLADPELLAPVVAYWRREAIQTKRAVLTDGRPTIPLETYVRLMVLKTRHGWGYRTLVAEVSDSIHLRRFCRIALSERVPDESTVRELTRRVGDETVSEITRALIRRAVREKRFTARAVWIDSTVTDADIKYPTDAGLAWAGVKGAGQGGVQACAVDQAAGPAGQGPVAVDGPHAACDHPHDSPPVGPGQGPRSSS